MTRRDVIQCIHEPFGDAFYYGPERLSTRFEEDQDAREKSGFKDSTYKTIFDRIEREDSEGKRIFIKDIIHYLIPPKGKPALIAPSLDFKKRGIGTNAQVNGGVHGDSGKAQRYPWSTSAEPDNPTVVPKSLLQNFHWIFLIRDPHRSIPSYFRCTIPPLDDVTGFYEFDPSEAGYIEVRLVFDYLRHVGSIGPHFAGGKSNGKPSNGDVSNGDATNGQRVNGHTSTGSNEICVINADDMLDFPAEYIEAVCDSTGLAYTPGMLDWDNEEDQGYAKAVFAKWPGFHEDAIDSTRLHARGEKIESKPVKSEEQWDEEWKEQYGAKAAKVIRETVNACMDDYLYMNQFALKL